MHGGSIGGDGNRDAAEGDATPAITSSRMQAAKLIFVPLVFVFLHIWGSLSPGFHRPHTKETCCFAPPERVRSGSGLLERPDLRPPQPTSARASPNRTRQWRGRLLTICWR